MTARVTLPEPIEIDTWEKNRRGEATRVMLSTFNGYNLVDVRSWYVGDVGKMKPGKGFAGAVKHLPRLMAAIAAATTRARELGLLEDDEEA
jgi:hypothetical protein